MSVYNADVKKKFNIHLSSLQTASWTGSLYDARYKVDLRGHLAEDDFQKQWDVYLTMQSDMTNDLASATGINPLDTYSIHLDIGPNFINSAAFRERATPNYIAFQSQYTNGANVYSRFDVGSQDNSPLRVTSLYNVSYIGFNVFNLIGQTTVPSTADYQVVLHFVEV